MGQFLLLLVVALTVAAVVFGVAVLLTGGDPGMGQVEPDGRAVPLPADRPLRETDIRTVRFDRAVRGYRMAQVDQALRRAAYDIGYKDELIGVLEAEIKALREGRTAEADGFRRAREAALVSTVAAPPAGAAGSDAPAERTEPAGERGDEPEEPPGSALGPVEGSPSAAPTVEGSPSAARTAEGSASAAPDDPAGNNTSVLTTPTSGQGNAAADPASTDVVVLPGTAGTRDDTARSERP